MNKDLQHWLGSNRPPRVQITYDVETLNSTVQAEIPFVVGIMGDFAGDTTLLSMADRTFTAIDRDSFKTVMQGLAPSLQLTGMSEYKVVRKPGGPGVQTDPAPADQFAPALSFCSVEDFAPPSIIKQVPYLQDLMTTRQNLHDLLSRLDTNPGLESSLIPPAAPVAPPAFALASSNLDKANAALGTTAAGTLKDFNDAVTDVLAVETTGANHDAVTAAQSAVTEAVGDTSKGWVKAHTDFGTAYTAYAGPPAVAAKAPAVATAAQAASSALTDLVTALQNGANLLTQITARYGDDPSETSAQTAAVTASTKAATSVGTFVLAAWTASLYLGSALFLTPPTPGS
jgi:type VI secretion system protein ImpB